MEEDGNKIWFRAKEYGWGWYPVTWQGWLVLAAYIFFNVWNFLRLDADSHSASDTLRPFIFQTLILTVLLILICHRKGEKPGWHWGDRDRKSE